MKRFRLEDVSAAMAQDTGFCVECGEEAYGVEPDARKYPCEACGEKEVYGAEELVVMGLVD